MDIRKIQNDEVLVTFTRSVTYSITTTVAAIQEALPEVAAMPYDGSTDAADVVFAWLASGAFMERDAWLTDQARREGDLIDETIEVEETEVV